LNLIVKPTRTEITSSALFALALAVPVLRLTAAVFAVIGHTIYWAWEFPIVCASLPVVILAPGPGIYGGMDPFMAIAIEFAWIFLSVLTIQLGLRKLGSLESKRKIKLGSILLVAAALPLTAYIGGPLLMVAVGTVFGVVFLAAFAGASPLEVVRAMFGMLPELYAVLGFCVPFFLPVAILGRWLKQQGAQEMK
jgi:hypothetical protein